MVCPASTNSITAVKTLSNSSLVQALTAIALEVCRVADDENKNHLHTKPQPTQNFFHLPKGNQYSMVPAFIRAMMSEYFFRIILRVLSSSRSSSTGSSFTQ